MTGKYDVLIIGGGLVGASLLCALASAIDEHGLKVALVEKREPATARQGTNLAGRTRAADGEE